MAGKKRSKKDADRILARILVVAVVTMVLLGAAVLFLQTDPGRMAMADRGFHASELWARERIGTTLLRAIDALGVPRDSVVVEPSTDERVGIVRFSIDGSLTAANLALTQAVEDAGGTVHYGRRVRTDDGEELELRFGTRVVLTHRVIVRVGAVPPPPPAMPKARLAVVIDDLGHNHNFLTRRALALPGPITFAVLPELKYSARLLTEVGRSGHQALLHLPMEADPETGYSAGEPQVRVDMSPPEIRALVERCLDGLPGVVGVNNHMGSRATESRAAMDAVMEVLAERGLVFLDSQTTPRSVAHVAASARGVPNLRNDIFLDADQADVALVLQRLEYLVERAQDRGWAVGIGHVNEATVTGLERFLPELERRGVVLVPLAELIHDRAS